MESIDETTEPEEKQFGKLPLDEFLLSLQKLKDSPFGTDTFNRIHETVMAELESKDEHEQKFHHSSFYIEHIIRYPEANKRVALKYSRTLYADELNIWVANLDTDYNKEYFELIRKRPVSSITHYQGNSKFLKIISSFVKRLNPKFDAVLTESKYERASVTVRKIRQRRNTTPSDYQTYDYKMEPLDNEQLKEFISLVDQLRENPMSEDYFKRLHKTSWGILNKNGVKEKRESHNGLLLDSYKNYRYVFEDCELEIEYAKFSSRDDNIFINLWRKDGSFINLGLHRQLGYQKLEDKISFRPILSLELNHSFKKHPSSVSISENASQVQRYEY